MTVTAVVVSHANENGLRTILNNLLRQTRPPDEIIALCSDSPHIAQMGVDYPTVMFREQDNQNDWGHAKRAEGLELARSEWVGFFNDDDSYVDHYLEAMLKRAEVEEAGVVYCAWNECPHCAFAGWQSTAGNFLCRTELGQRVGWHERYWHADATFIDGLKAAGARVVKVDEILYHHNVQ
jgi:hypothetical protein